MRTPEKKALSRLPEVAPKPHGIIRRTSTRREQPMKQLAEFDPA